MIVYNSLDCSNNTSYISQVVEKFIKNKTIIVNSKGICFKPNVLFYRSFYFEILAYDILLFQ